MTWQTWEIILPSEPERYFILNRFQMKVEVIWNRHFCNLHFMFSKVLTARARQQNCFWLREGKKVDISYSFLQMYSSITLVHRNTMQIFLKLENTVVDALLNKVLSHLRSNQWQFARLLLTPDHLPSESSF